MLWGTYKNGLVIYVWLSVDRQGHLSMVIQLLRYGADPSMADGEGYRSLHLAILFQHMPIAAYLMAKGQVRLFLSCSLFLSQPSRFYSCAFSSLLSPLFSLQSNMAFFSWVFRFFFFCCCRKLTFLTQMGRHPWCWQHRRSLGTFPCKPMITCFFSMYSYNNICPQ